MPCPRLAFVAARHTCARPTSHATCISLSLSIYIYIYIYIYRQILHIYIYIYIYTYRARGADGRSGFVPSSAKRATSKGGTNSVVKTIGYALSQLQIICITFCYLRTKPLPRLELAPRRPRATGRARTRALARGQERGNFTRQDSEILQRGFCGDSSSPQISAILVGHFTGENGSLRGLGRTASMLALHPIRITRSASSASQPLKISWPLPR